MIFIINNKIMMKQNLQNIKQNYIHDNKQSWNDNSTSLYNKSSLRQYCFIN